MNVLDQVQAAAGERLRASADRNADAEALASSALQAAVAAAMAAGAELSDIVAGETGGRDRVREELQPDALRRVKRSAEKAREAEAEHHRQITRADRLGVPRRLVAEAAGCAQGTIKSIVTAAAASSNGATPTEIPAPVGDAGEVAESGMVDGPEVASHSP